MADETKSDAVTAPVATVPVTAAAQRAEAVKAYYDATTPEAKAALVNKYPELKDVFSVGNHS